VFRKPRHRWENYIEWVLKKRNVKIINLLTYLLTYSMEQNPS